MKHYYAGHSYMGLNFTFDSPCWKVYSFETLKKRNEWLEKHEYNQMTGNYVARAITLKEVQMIIGRENEHHKYVHNYDGEGLLIRMAV